VRFRCVNGICVVQRTESRKQIGSILLPDNAQKKSETAVVLQVPPPWREDGAERQTMLKVGDVVCISKYSGQEFEIGGNDFNGAIVLVREKDILCILDEVSPLDPPVVESPRASSEPHFWGDGIGAAPAQA